MAWRGLGRVAGRTGIRRGLIVAAGITAAAGVGWTVYAEALQPAPLETLVPESVVAFGSGDARWAWDATRDLRAGGEPAKAIAEFQKQTGLSIEQDVLPWAGQVSAALLGVDRRQPQAAFFVEVRNPVQYYVTMARLRTRLERQASRYWKAADYSGVPLRYTYVGHGRHRMPVSTAWLKGWVVVGVGNGTTKRIIDVWQDRKPSIADNAAWAGTLARIPQERIGWGGVNSGLLSGAYRPVGIPKEFFEMGRTVSAGAVNALDDGFRVASATTPTAPASRDLYTKLGNNLTPITDDLLDRMPDGTFVTIAVSNPGVWWDVYEPMFTRLASEGGPRDRAAAEKAAKALQPVREIVRRAEGGLALGVAFRPDGGFGFAVVGDCRTPDAAQASAKELRRFVEAHGQTVAVSEDGTTYTVGGPEQGGGPVQLSPTWSASGNYLALASNAPWLQPGTGAQRVPLPTEAQGAQIVAKGNFRFVAPLLESLNLQKPEGGPSKEKILQGWQRTQLENAYWQTWSVIRPDGTSTGTGELRNWPWRSALRSLAEPKEAPGHQAEVLP